MGPLDERGKSPQSASGNVVDDASMGPRFDERGKPVPLITRLGIRRSFNGAALR